MIVTKEKEHQNGYQNVEIVDELVLETLQKSRFEKFVPCLCWNEGDQEQKHRRNLRIQESGNQCPVQTHDYCIFGLTSSKRLKWIKLMVSLFQYLTRVASELKTSRSFLRRVLVTSERWFESKKFTNLLTIVSTYQPIVSKIHDKLK